MFGGTLKWKPLAKYAIVGFKTTATSLYHVAFIHLKSRHGWIVFAFSWEKDGQTFLQA